MNTVTLTRPEPQGLAPANMQAQFNNAYAQAIASADPRHALKSYDRAGLSRGGAQLNQAGIDSANNLADGIANAYSQDAQNAAYNATARLQFQGEQERAAQNLGGLQSNAAYQDQMNQMLMQQSLAEMANGMFSAPPTQAPQINLQGLISGPATSAPIFNLPNPSQQLADLRSGNRSRQLLGALLR